MQTRYGNYLAPRSVFRKLGLHNLATSSGPSGRPKSLVRGADYDLGSVCAFRGIPQVCRVQMTSLAAKLSFLDGVVNSQSVNRRSSVAQGKIKAFLYSFECPRYICLAFLGFQDAAMAIGMKLSLLQRASSLYGSSSSPQMSAGQWPGVRRPAKLQIFSE